jgi:hypothetical protein
MKLKPGMRIKSAVCDTEVVVIRAPKSGLPFCGGAEMLAPTEARPTVGASLDPHSKGTVLGKRYFDEESDLELLCAKGGLGSLTIEGRPLAIREAKKLPSSD